MVHDRPYLEWVFWFFYRDGGYGASVDEPLVDNGSPRVEFRFASMVSSSSFPFRNNLLMTECVCASENRCVCVWVYVRDPLAMELSKKSAPCFSLALKMVSTRPLKNGTHERGRLELALVLLLTPPKAREERERETILIMRLEEAPYLPHVIFHA